jgi:hypothetical protein
LDTITDEEFAILANDAEWLHTQQVQINQIKTLGVIS